MSSNSTPTHSSSTTNSHSASSHTRSRRSNRFASQHPHTLQYVTPLTSVQQDRQARNKDPYRSHSEDDDSDDMSRESRYDYYGNEKNDSFLNIQMRRDAAIKLDNPELVMMYAQARGDSIPATTHRLKKIMCGFMTASDLEDEEEIERRIKRQRALEGRDTKNSRGSNGAGGAGGSGSGGSSEKKNRVVSGGSGIGEGEL